MLSKDNNEIPQKNITISIILSESTASLFKLDVPHLDDITGRDSVPKVCSIKPITNLNALLEKSTETLNDTENDSSWSLISQERYERESNKVMSEVAYISQKVNDSSSSIDVIDDLSDESVMQDEQESHLILDAVKVYTRPLVAIKSIAHQNNLTATENQIFVNVLEKDLMVTESGWVNVCRICHGGVSTGDLLSPCRCRGSVALAHLNCLERWLRESATSRCELCQYHYKIIRKPKYSVPRSIVLFLRHPGDHLREILFDSVALAFYTPSAIISTYMLMLLCDAVAKHSLKSNDTVSAHVMTFVAVFGIAAIDFIYTSWLIITFQKHAEAWKSWYRNNCDLRLILPPWKRKCIKRK